MKRKVTLFTIVLMAMSLLGSCSLGIGKGDRRDRNLQQALLTRLDTVPGVEYIGKSDVRQIHENGTTRLSAVIIYFVTDSLGERSERNALVTTSDDCAEIYSWEELDTRILTDVKQQVTEKMEEVGLPIDGSLIDAIIALKKRTL